MNKKIVLIISIIILSSILVSTYSHAKIIKSEINDETEEYHNYGLILDERFSHEPTDGLSDSSYYLPTSFDWRNVKGFDFTTPVKDQEDCGSCYAFAAVGALESRIKIEKFDPNYNIDLSEQYVVSCCRKGNCNGCWGGNAEDVFRWMKSNGAIFESCFDYSSSNWAQTGEIEPCENKCNDWEDNKIELDGFKNVQSGVYHFKRYLIKYGPFAATLYAGRDLDRYRGGVYHNDRANNNPPNHQVVIVGYQDTERSLLKPYDGYWICKNSWGTQWGENGYFKIAYGCAHIDDPSGYWGDYVAPLYYEPDTPQPDVEVDVETLNFPSLKENKQKFTITNNGDSGSNLIWYAKIRYESTPVDSVSPSWGILQRGEYEEVEVTIDWRRANSGLVSSIEIHRYGGSYQEEAEIDLRKPNYKTKSIDIFNLLKFKNNIIEYLFSMSNIVL